MQTLFIPDLIEIKLERNRTSFFTKYFRETSSEPFKQDKIIVSINTFATHKNDVTISPFLSDKNGHITITKKQLIERKDLFISYGLMDYQSIESAKPDIEICLLGKQSIEREINYLKRILQGKKDLDLYNRLGDKVGKQVIKSAEIERQEREDLDVLESCFNHNFKFKSDITLVTDKWDKPCSVKNYEASISV